MLGLESLAHRLFGSVNERKLKSYQARVLRINALEPDFEALSDDALRATTSALKARLANGETLDDVLEEAFAAVREAARRALGQRHYDVQLIGGMALHDGKISEMKTGEGKTLVATLPCYLNALTGAPVHVVTVNDYLAERDADWMRGVHEALRELEPDGREADARYVLVQGMRAASVRGAPPAAHVRARRRG
ncbi:MAG: hypothetical protein VXZ78_05520, partial [Pseudomonadota bacterium]|nr:hypothetical protein [Pseudomonadota bacterium]